MALKKKTMEGDVFKFAFCVFSSWLWLLFVLNFVVLLIVASFSHLKYGLAFFNPSRVCLALGTFWSETTSLENLV